MTKLPRDEFGEQQAFVHYLQLLQNKGKVVKYTAVPNNTWTPSNKQKTKNRELGLRAGFPDLVILTRRTFLCIEMKVKPNKSTPDQQDWQRAINNLNADFRNLVFARVCYGFDEAKQLIDSIVKVEDQYDLQIAS